MTPAGSNTTNMKSRSRAARIFVLSGLAGALMLAGATPAHAVVAAAGPGAFAAGYATRVVVTPAGGPVTFVNGDAADHTLTAADAKLPKRVAKRTKRCRGYSPRSCPLFTTPVVASGESAEVEGLNRVKAGRQYDFVCQIHGSMTGTLVVAGAASR